jgi:hypothetical protein
MSDLRYTLLPEGSSDRALIPLITWLLRDIGIRCAIQSNLADVWRLREKPQSLKEKIIRSIELYPCDLLLIHRDADREPLETRVAEVQDAVQEARQLTSVSPVVCVVPVRMQEAWLLFDAAAIRRAAGNPNGREVLRLPELRRVESLPDPKTELYNLIRTASGLTGHRLKRLKVRSLSSRASQVSGYIENFAPLRVLSAFKRLETNLRAVVNEQGWDN